MSGRKHWLMVVASSVVLSSFTAGSIATAQERFEDPWSAFRFLVGSWDGLETGAAGIGKGDRTYEFIMGGKYLFHRNTSEFEPQERNPDGEVHEDWAIFSYDENRQRVALREFHIEGFVINYVLAHFDEESKRAVFVSEKIENGPPGMAARYSLIFTSEDSFEELFEIASSGQDLEVLIRNSWTRR